MPKKTDTPEDKAPPPTFEELARQLECDEDEGRFEEVVKRIAKSEKAKSTEADSTGE